MPPWRTTLDGLQLHTAVALLCYLSCCEVVPLVHSLAVPVQGLAGKARTVAGRDSSILLTP